MAHYDKDNDGRLSFQEFLPIVLSVDDSELRFETAQREPRRVTSKEILIPEIEKLLAEILEREINLMASAEKSREDLVRRKDFNCLEVFKSIDCRREKFIDVESLSLYLKSNKANVEAKDVIAFVRRFDMDRDCMLSLVEFMNGILPMKERVKGKKRVIGGRNAMAMTSSKGFAKGLSTPSKSKQRYSRNKSTGSKIFHSEQKKTPTHLTNKSPLKPILKSSADKKSPAAAQIPNILKKQAHHEYSMEMLKQSIAETRDVSLKLLYSIFDPDNKGHILFRDFTQVFHNFHLTPSEGELNMLFNALDKDGDGKLSYEDVYDVFIPQSRKHAEILLSKENPAHSISNSSCELIRKLLQKYVSAEHIRRAETISSASIQQAFEECDYNRKGFITMHDVMHI